MEQSVGAPPKCEACKGRGLGEDNKPCPPCKGYGFIMNGGTEMSQAPVQAPVQEVPKKRPPYYPDRYMNCREETLKEWKEVLEKEITKLEAQIEERRGGIDQINDELANRKQRKKRA